MKRTNLFTCIKLQNIRTFFGMRLFSGFCMESAWFHRAISSASPGNFLVFFSRDPVLSTVLYELPRFACSSLFHFSVLVSVPGISFLLFLVNSRPHWSSSHTKKTVHVLDSQKISSAVNPIEKRLQDQRSTVSRIITRKFKKQKLNILIIQFIL